MTHGNKRSSWLLPSSPDGVTFLRHLRMHHKLTSEKAAEMAGISNGHYSMIENSRKEVSEDVLAKLEAFLQQLGYDEKIQRQVLR